VAAAHLTAAAQHETARLLDGQTLADVSFWADEIRNHRPETSRWHFVDIPRDRDDYRPERDCQRTERGDCIIAAITRLRTRLDDLQTPFDERAEALRYLVHLVADLHQPLHCVDDHDRGGNDVAVTVFGRPMNLHAAWDTGLIAVSGLSEATWTQRLEAWLAGQDTTRLATGTVVDWALESHRAAVEHVYALPPSGRLGRRYLEASRPVLERQLALGAIRLARVLNEAFAR